MIDKTEALRLADILQHKIPSIECLEVAAAELRRLHAENQKLREEVAELKVWVEVEAGQLKRAVAVEREACAKVLDDWKKHNWTFEDCAAVIRARGNI